MKMSDECCNISKNESELPVSILVLGMAGSGKSTLISNLASFLEASHKKCLTVNLDPAVYDPGYFANIDIRDAISYNDIKDQYSIGPNGSIVTSLNLFATKFQKVLDILSQKASTHKYFLFDTPGQIEVFTWSASGTIISESLASSTPTVILYMMDAHESDDVSFFMRNMLCSCLIAMNYDVPFIPVFNKIDVQDSRKLVDWMKDFELLDKEFGKEGSTREDYSLFLHLEEFYCDFKPVSISSTTGQGFDDLLKAIGEAKDEYIREYKPIYEQLHAKSQKKITGMFEVLTKMGLDEAYANIVCKEGNSENSTD